MGVGTVKLDYSSTIVLDEEGIGRLIDQIHQPLCDRNIDFIFLKPLRNQQRLLAPFVNERLLRRS